MNLKNIETSLKNVISTISNLTNMEYAIFDTDSKLVASTPAYLKRKGNNVHTTSIAEVLNQGNVIVNKPGRMLSCFGCRFENNCPATIELLSCIDLNSSPIGVISLTSFSQKGHDTIENNLRHYIELLEHLSDLISMYAANESSRLDNTILHKSIESIENNSNNNLILINNHGTLVHWDQNIQDLFPNSNFCTQTINQIFPSEVTNWLFSTKEQSQRYFIIENIDYLIYSVPLKIENDIIGYALYIENNNISSDTNTNEDYLDAIVTNNKEMNNIKDMILKINNSPSPVLISGATGTGKEMMAKAIHYTGNRKNFPFVPINCASIPESLFESELFGYEEGAFTGAKKGGKFGLFEMADGGTIFLDEIEELPLHLQSKLLRVLQDKNIQRVGANKPIPIDIRIISATNKDLEKMIEEGNFRDDLFYRLNVIQIELPSLKNRMNDVELLTKHFISKYNNILHKHIESISKEALEILKSYEWLGNIRELENAIEYAINIEVASIIQPNSLPKRIISNTSSNMKDQAAKNEYQFIVNLLDKNGWDVKGKEKTADEMGISLRTLYRKLQESN